MVIDVPCPWCGDTEKLVLERTETFAWRVHCKRCCADGPASQTSDEARDRWGQRKEQANGLNAGGGKGGEPVGSGKR